MTRFSFHFLCILLTVNHLAQAQTVRTVKTSVQRATVFQQGVQLFSTESISLPSGQSDVIFEGVSPLLQPNSLQAAGNGNFVIMDIRYKLKYSEAKSAMPDDPTLQRLKLELKAAQDSLQDLNFDAEELQQKQSALQTERQILLNNKMMKGEFQRDSLVLFQQSLDFLRQRLANIDAELLKLKKVHAKREILRGQLNTRISTLTTLISGNYPTENGNPKPVPQIIVTVMADAPTAATLTVSYFVASAGWTAAYDLRASKENQNIELKHRAAVFQSTQVEWKDVALTLSTGNPNQSSVKPILTPFVVGFDQPIPVTYSRAMKKQAMPQAAPTNSQMNESVAVYGARDEKAKDDVADYVEMSENLLRVEYEIKLKYTIPSDNQQHNVVIQTKTLPATYAFSVIPKLDPDVFLIARVTDWEDLNLVAGDARIYFDGSFVGETTINPRSTNDTLLLNLGRDKSIVVTRTKLKDRSKERFLSDQKAVTKTFEIGVRNTKSAAIRLVVEDQIPISRDNDIKIENLEDSSAKYNPETGKLTWDLNLKSKDAKRLIFSYEVKFPKDKSVSNL